MIALAAYDQFSYRSRLCMDKYNEIGNTFIQNKVGEKCDNYINVRY